MPIDDSECPFLLCLTRVVLFFVIAFFMLAVPLGDPQEVCEVNNDSERKPAFVCILNDYMINFMRNTLYLLDVLASATLSALHEGKLTVYSLLSTIDKADYCRAGTCYRDEGAHKTEQMNSHNNNNNKKTIQYGTHYCKTKYSKKFK